MSQNHTVALLVSFQLPFLYFKAPKGLPVDLLLLCQPSLFCSCCQVKRKVQQKMRSGLVIKDAGAFALTVL